MSKESLLDWYKVGLNEDEGITRMTIPVIPNHMEVPQGIEPEPEPEVVIVKKEDPVVEKDKDTSLISFVMAKKIQDLLVRIAGLNEPYESDSEERQILVDKVKTIYTKLGENIGSL